ncbi:MAG: energy transducer TonB [Bacteroidales bacterium]|jgi:protein TonB
MKDRQAFDDLIFEKRNKEYGAYKLRKNYSRLVNRSLLVAILAVSLAVIIPFLNVLSKPDPYGTRAGTMFVSVQMDKLEPPKEEILIPPSTPPPPASQPAVRYVPPVVVDSIPPTEKQIPTVADVQASPDKNNQEVTVSTSASENELIGDPAGNGDEPFMIVEVLPTFRGGNLEKFREWVKNRVVYPQMAEENHIRGKVYLTFVVERDGSVSTVQIVKGIDKLLDDAAVKAIESSPKWSPGLQRGRPVRVRFSIYLNFQL